MPAISSVLLRLFDEVELGAEVHLELVGERAQLQQLRRLGPLLEELDRRSGRARGRASTSSTIPGRRTLTTTSRPSARSARVDLRDRGGGERLRVELDERASPRSSRTTSLDLGERKGRHLVDELARAPRCRRRAAGPGREESSCPSLRKVVPELLESQAELDRAFLGRRPAARDAELAQHAHELAPARDAARLPLHAEHGRIREPSIVLPRGRGPVKRSEQVGADRRGELGLRDRALELRLDPAVSGRRGRPTARVASPTAASSGCSPASGRCPGRPRRG